MSAVLRPRDGQAANSGRLAAIWLISTITTLALCGRIYARYRRFKRFFWDDFFVVLAWSIAMVMAAQTTVISSYDNEVGDHSNLTAFIGRPLGQGLFYTSLWCVKISFLIFFRSIGACQLPGLKKYWMFVLGITIVTFLAIWAVNPYGCWAKLGVLQCESVHGATAKRRVSLSVATVLIGVTDCLIIAIPFVLLSNVKKIAMRKKVILYILFSVEIVCVIVSIVRCVIATKESTGKDGGLKIRLLAFLTHVEVNIAIAVACVGSLRSLFTHDDQSQARSYAPPKSLRVSEKNSGTPTSQPRIGISLGQHERNSITSMPLIPLPAKSLE